MKYRNSYPAFSTIALVLLGFVEEKALPWLKLCKCLASVKTLWKYEEDIDSSGVSGDVAKAAKEACKGKKGAKAKANAITAYICDHVQYPSPNYSDHHKCPAEVLKSGYSNCCDRARLGYEMAKVVNLKARGVHGPNHVWVQYYVDGSWQDSDPGYARRSLGQVYQNMSMDRLWEFPSC